MKHTQIVVKLPETMNKDIEKIASEDMISKSAEIRRLVAIGIQKSKLEKAISVYIHDNAKISNAANISGLSLSDFADELTKKGITITKEFTPGYLNKTRAVMEKV